MEGDASEPAFSADVDALLSVSERAQRTAWIAHMESALGDLVVRYPLPIPIPFGSNMRFIAGPCFLLHSRELCCRHTTHSIFLLQPPTIVLRP